MKFDLDFFRDELKRHAGITFSDQIVYRAIRQTDPPIDPFFSEHTYAKGGRFNFPGDFPALYVSLTDFVTLMEVGSRPDPLSSIKYNAAFSPKNVVSIKISGKFVDLVSENSLRQLGFTSDFPEYISPSHLWIKTRGTGSAPVISQEIGKIVYDAGWDGIFYISSEAYFKLFDRYSRERLANLCVFISKKDYITPKNKSCKLALL